jgi:hypothetical protein
MYSSEDQLNKKLLNCLKLINYPQQFNFVFQVLNRIRKKVCNSGTML